MGRGELPPRTPFFFTFSAGAGQIVLGAVTPIAKVATGTSGTINLSTIAVNAGDPAASIVIDIFKTTVGSYGTGASITASAKPTLTSATIAQDSTLTGWTTAFVAGDLFYAKILSLSGTIHGVAVTLDWT